MQNDNASSLFAKLALYVCARQLFVIEIRVEGGGELEVFHGTLLWTIMFFPSFTRIIYTEFYY